MERALALARRHLPHPNPRVGAVIIDTSGLAVGEGAHEAPGLPHAEVLALSAAGTRARGGTLFVTLEPCAHHGRTPPCVDAIITSGLARVVVGAIDPDPQVRGRGVTRLEQAGIEVETGVLGREVEEVDPGYFQHRRTGLPLFTLKAAMTLDGQVAAADGTSRWISSDEARKDAHRLRAEVDAIMVGSGTLAADAPRLDIRLPGYQGRQPRPIVVKGKGPLARLGALGERRPLVISTDGEGLPSGAEAMTVPAGADGRPDLGEAARLLGEMGILHVLVEGGPTLSAGLLEQHLISKGVFYLAAKLAGGLGRGVFAGSWSTLNRVYEIEIRAVTRLGADFRVDFDLKV